MARSNNKIISPNGNTGMKEATTITQIETEIKSEIVKSTKNGAPLQTIVNNINKIIAAGILLLPPLLQVDARRSFANSAKGWIVEYRMNMETYLLNLAMRMNRNGYQISLTGNIEEDMPRFRGYITNAKKGNIYVEDYWKRVREQTKTLASQGARVDKNGRTLNLRNLAEMEIRYNETQKDIQEMASEGVELVYISSHADCSKRCEKYQGGLYSLGSGLSGVIDGIPYTPLEDVMQLNNGNSIISGYNCRHYLIPYQKGLKAPAEYSKATIKRERQIDTKQRYYENNIRQYKINARLEREQGNDEYAEKLEEKARIKTREYEEFSKRNGRAFYRNRTQVINGELVMD